MWIYFNPNPCGRKIGDCAVRALAKALDLGWEEAYAEMCLAGFRMCDMPTSNEVWGSVLRQHGFVRESIPNECPDCYTAADFCREHPEGTYVLGFGSHTATVQGGDLYDSWDSSMNSPQYYWKRKEK